MVGEKKGSFSVVHQVKGSRTPGEPNGMTNVRRWTVKGKVKGSSRTGRGGSVCLSVCVEQKFRCASQKPRD